jgi:hypothetical protein
MLRTSQVTIGTMLTIIGKDLDAGATFNGDIDPAAGKQKAGRFMSYNAATKTLIPWDGLTDATGDTIFGVLADDVLTDLTNHEPVMVYRRGTFLRQEIETANNAVIGAGGALDLALSDKGIFLEFSYEGYQGLEGAPAGGTIP